MSARNHRRQNGGYSSRGGGHPNNNFRDDKKRPYNDGGHYNNRRTQQRNSFNIVPNNKAFEDNNHQRNVNNYNPHHHHHFKNKETSGHNTHFKEHSAQRPFQNSQPHPYHQGPQKNQTTHYNPRNFNPFSTEYNFNPYQVDQVGIDWTQPIPGEKLESVENESRIRMNVAVQNIGEAPSIFYKARKSLNVPIIPYLPLIDTRGMDPKDPKTMLQMEKFRDSIINARI